MVNVYDQDFVGLDAISAVFKLHGYLTLMAKSSFSFMNCLMQSLLKSLNLHEKFHTYALERR